MGNDLKGGDISQLVGGSRVTRNVVIGVNEVVTGAASATITGITGTLAHGNAITVNGSGFGTKNRQFSRFWVNGSDIYVDGVNQPNETVGGALDTTNVWHSVSSPANNSIVNSNLRHSNVDQQYLSKQQFFSVPLPYESTDPVSDLTIYFRYWLNSLQNYSKSTVATFSSVSGSFLIDSDFFPGESSTFLDSSGGNSRTVYVSYIDTVNKKITFYELGTAVNETLMTNATITGNTSGAVLTFTSNAYDSSSAGTAWAHPWSTKPVRFWQHSSALPRIEAAALSSNGGMNLHYIDSSGTLTYGPVQYGMTDWASNPGTWRCLEVEYTLAGTGKTGEVRVKVDNGSTYVYANIDTSYRSTTEGVFASLIGLDTPGLGSVGSNLTLGLSRRWGEIYADNDLKRWVIGDASALSNCTKTEVQRITSFSDTNCGLAINKGAFTSLTGKYLFLVGSNFTELASYPL